MFLGNLNQGAVYRLFPQLLLVWVDSSCVIFIHIKIKRYWLTLYYGETCLTHPQLQSFPHLGRQNKKPKKKNSLIWIKVSIAILLCPHIRKLPPSKHAWFTIKQTCKQLPQVSICSRHTAFTWHCLFIWVNLQGHYCTSFPQQIDATSWCVGVLFLSHCQTFFQSVPATWPLALPSP